MSIIFKILITSLSKKEKNKKDKNKFEVYFN